MDLREQFCPNMACPARGKVGENIVVHSRKEARYQCKICGKTFAATSGTPFYRLHHPADWMVIVVTLIAHGCPLQAIVAAFHLDERTVMDWQERAGRHCQRVHEQLVLHPRDLEHVQADEIRVKAQGKVIWLAMAIMVSTRLWLGEVIARKRDEHLILGLMQIIRQCALARPLLICVDGFIAYVQAVQLVFRSPLPNGQRGRPWLIPWPDIHIGQVVKRYRGKRVVDVTRRMAQGCLKAAQALLAKSHGGTKLQHRFHRAAERHLPLSLGRLGTAQSSADPQPANLGATHVSDGLCLQLLHRAQEPALEAVGGQPWLPLGTTNPSHRRWSYRSYLDC